jgi:hypothetical protein
MDKPIPSAQSAQWKSETYNFMIVRNSHEQLFCDSKEYLETMKRFL